MVTMVTMVTYHFIIFHVVPLPCGTVLTVWQTEPQPDVVLAVELLILGDTHDEVGDAELAHVYVAILLYPGVITNISSLPAVPLSTATTLAPHCPHSFSPTRAAAGMWGCQAGSGLGNRKLVLTDLTIIIYPVVSVEPPRPIRNYILMPPPPCPPHT